jgi:hypothetical protein
MNKVCEYVLTDINFNAHRPQTLSISLPAGSKILRNNSCSADPKKIFYYWNSSNGTKQEKRILYLFKHHNSGTMLEEKVDDSGHIKTFEANGAIWHLFESKKSA